MKSIKVIFLLLMLSFCAQCEYLSFQKNKEEVSLDTIVDFTSVDTPPIFSNCKDFINKKKQDSCFSFTLSTLFSKELSNKAYKDKLVVRSAIDDTVRLKISINKEGVLQLKDVMLSDEILKEIPEIQKIFTQSVQKLPKVFPAIKRGIPVTTEYILPIRISLEN